MIQDNPNGVIKSFAAFCDAVGAWNSPSQDLSDAFKKVLSFVDFVGRMINGDQTLF
jgi:hypothetical protein